MGQDVVEEESPPPAPIGFGADPSSERRGGLGEIAGVEGEVVITGLTGRVVTVGVTTGAI